MKKRNVAWLPLFILFAFCPVVRGQADAQPPKAKAKSAQSPGTDAQKKNIQEYIELMRSNVRDQKAEIMGAVMQLTTDDEADELIQKALDYQKQRSELLAKYYLRMKQSLGAITAARFIQVEHQLLLIIDLQIASSLPVVGEGS